MSKYRHYEFQAIDRPLTTDQMRWLRGLSTRARITPTSFVNMYHYPRPSRPMPSLGSGVRPEGLPEANLALPLEATAPR